MVQPSNPAGLPWHPVFYVEKVMARSKSSQRWLKEHFDDPFVKRAQQEGYRSRAVFKLEEIQKKDRILKPGMVVVDLGAAPGGWAQYALKHIGKSGRLIGLDILPIEPLPGLEVLQGDFREQEVLDRLMETLNHQPVDLVMSDMAPNISGLSTVDQPRAIYLCELALMLAKELLAPNGTFLVKIMQGEGVDAYIKEIRQAFNKLVFRKPSASRARSREVYVVATGRKL